MTRAELEAAGFSVSDDAHALLARYVSLLLAENQHLNLTGVRHAPTLWRAHICDSLALLRVLGEGRPLRILDIGTGGGMPGIPLACVDAGLDLTLLDATQKKTAAVERFAAGLGLENVQVVWARAEQLVTAPVHRQKYDVVTARAVANLSKLLADAPAFLRPGGRIWLFKSRQALGAESQAALPTVRRARLRPLEPVYYLLPGDTHERVLLGYERAG
jgi:16S rRNA (guanine527-N7)-methyltransferase